MERGILEGKHGTLLFLLRHRNKNISCKMKDGNAKINSLEELDAIIARAIDASFLEELEL